MKITDLLTHGSKISRQKVCKLKLKKTKLSRYWDYRADGSQAKAKLYNFKTLCLDISFANNIEICHLCFANCKRPSEYLNIFNCTVFNFENSL